MPERKSAMLFRVALAGSLALGLAACDQVEPLSRGETLTRGFIPPAEIESKVQVGNTQEQVLINLGTPSTIATINGDVFYYISQQQYRRFMFQPPRTINQNVLTVYFDKNRKVQRVANYGMEDGKVFDFVSRTTVTGGEEVNILRRLLSGPST